MRKTRLRSLLPFKYVALPFGYLFWHNSCRHYLAKKQERKNQQFIIELLIFYCKKRLTNNEKNAAKPFVIEQYEGGNRMDRYPYTVMNKLDSILHGADKAAWLLSKSPEKDFSRHRKLPFHRLVKLLIGMEGSALSHEMLNCFHFSRHTPSASAFIQQRAKLRPEAMQYVFSEVNKAFPCHSNPEGYRLIACDGSDLHYAANPKDVDCFFQSDTQSRGYNLLHLNVLYDLCGRRYVDTVVQSRRQADEVGAFISMIDRFPTDQKTIFIADRGYESYNVMAHIIEKSRYFLIRVKHPDSSGILRKLDVPPDQPFDAAFHLLLTKIQTKQVKANPSLYRVVPRTSRFDFCDPQSRLFYPLHFRVVAVEISKGCYEYLVTNLEPSSFPPDELKRLYRLRWGVETAFRDLKYTVGLSGFHSKRAEFICQEVFARLILYNLCELVATHTALFTHTDSHVHQLNFSAAVHIFRHALFLNPHDPPPDVVALIRRYLLPLRPGRCDPRKVKFRSAVSFIYRIA